MKATLEGFTPDQIKMAVNYFSAVFPNCAVATPDASGAPALADLSATQAAEQIIFDRHAQDAAYYLKYCTAWGLLPGYLHQPFTATGSGRCYKVIGAKAGSRKYPVLAMRVGGGSVYKFAATAVATYFAAKGQSILRGPTISSTITP